MNGMSFIRDQLIFSQSLEIIIWGNHYSWKITVNIEGDDSGGHANIINLEIIDE